MTLNSNAAPFAPAGAAAATKGLGEARHAHDAETTDSSHSASDTEASLSSGDARSRRNSAVAASVPQPQGASLPWLDGAHLPAPRPAAASTTTATRGRKATKASRPGAGGGVAVSAARASLRAQGNMVMACVGPLSPSLPPSAAAAPASVRSPAASVPPPGFAEHRAATEAIASLCGYGSAASRSSGQVLSSVPGGAPMHMHQPEYNPWCYGVQTSPYNFADVDAYNAGGADAYGYDAGAAAFAFEHSADFAQYDQMYEESAGDYYMDELAETPPSAEPVKITMTSPPQAVTCAPPGLEDELPMRMLLPTQFREEGQYASAMECWTRFGFDAVAAS